MGNEFLMIGCGHMGGALLRGWMQSAALAKFTRVGVVKPSVPNAAGRLAGVEYATSLAELATPPAIIVLAVKPAMLGAVLEDCKKQFGTGPLYISIAAGVTLEAMQGIFGADAAIIRAMPNTPTEVFKGVTGLAASPAVHSDMHGRVSALFSALGLAVWVKEEEMDALTALSGSGPAYAYYFMECLAEAAKELGLTSVDADRIARQMVLGASTLAAESSKPLHTLREEVTSPGGTTQAALGVWMQPGTLDAQAKKALNAAHTRARELANG